ncbi:sulfatase family protein [Dermatobacter hominis]|uniref:sulfatase family protein n=1 Tax=Dermatobacter hominis TaxID=2884263 RepID=UPI001D102B71|nr:sulfatase [Dermatobacter hominis]UDY35163.1 sulfatase [Dermatobacter hominis]
MTPPNVLYLHSHDTGRYVQPYGHQVPTPNIQHLADQGVLFRQAFCSAPVCSGSRAALLTGQSTHATGMLGLAHRGYRLTHPDRHVVHVLRDHGYWSGLIGEQHVSADPADVGYDHVEELDSTKVRDVAPAATRLIAERVSTDRPFFLSVGFFETHREYFEPSSIRDALYSRPPDGIVDTPATRRDVAAFKASARSLDQGVGAVLEALEEHHLADRTLVILTTDHGLAYPDAKATMFDRGIGVMLVLRGPGGFVGGQVRDALVSQLDIYPTICDVVGIERPEWLEGESLVPLVTGQVESVRDEVFAEVTYHAAYEPQRAIRTDRFKYMRRFDADHRGRVLANLDDGPTKDVLLAAGWGEVEPPAEALYDLVLDPAEGTNRIDDPALADVLADLRARLRDWMERTGDPLLRGPVPPAPGTQTNSVDQVSPSEPTTSH